MNVRECDQFCGYSGAHYDVLTILLLLSDWWSTDHCDRGGVYDVVKCGDRLWLVVVVMSTASSNRSVSNVPVAIVVVLLLVLQVTVYVLRAVDLQELRHPVVYGGCQHIVGVVGDRGCADHLMEWSVRIAIVDHLLLLLLLLCG